jgi:outer membrane immunogenic protein
MRKVFSVFILLSFFALINAQSPIGKGQKQLNFGLGFSGWGVPVYLGMDFGVHPDISLGGEISFRSYSDNYYGNSYSHTIVGFDFNGNYHFNRVLEIPKNWDLYAGLNLGFYYWSSSNDYHGSGSSGLGLGLQIGGRYYFSDKWAINLELGGGNVSGGKIGLTCKL